MEYPESGAHDDGEFDDLGYPDLVRDIALELFREIEAYVLVIATLCFFLGNALEYHGFTGAASRAGYVTIVAVIAFFGFAEREHESFQEDLADELHRRRSDVESFMHDHAIPVEKLPLKEIATRPPFRGIWHAKRVGRIIVRFHGLANLNLSIRAAQRRIR